MKKRELNENILLKEAYNRNVLEKIQSMIDQANMAFESNMNEYGDSTKLCLLNKEGGLYGLDGKIKLYKNGYIMIPLCTPYDTGNYNYEKIKVFVKKGDGFKFYYDETHMDYDWRDAQKILKNVVADALRYKKDMEGYDPNWEDDNNVEAIKQHNKSIGVKANRGLYECFSDKEIKQKINELINK